MSARDTPGRKLVVYDRTFYLCAAVVVGCALGLIYLLFISTPALRAML